MAFFSEHAQLIQQTITAMQMRPPEKDDDRETLTILFLELLLANREDYDKWARLTIQDLGNQLVQHLHVAKERGDFSQLFVALTRVAREKALRAKTSGGDAENGMVMYYPMANPAQLTENERREWSYQQAILPVRVIQSMLEKIDLSDITVEEIVSASKAKATEVAKQIRSDIASFKKEMDDHRSFVDKLRTDYNFVGLAQAFSDMAADKKYELSGLRILTLVLGFLCLVPLGTEAWILVNLEIPHDIKSLWPFATLTVGIVGLLLYYFRVVLHNFQSVKGQLLQLNLRKSICAFIEGYADFAIEHSEVDLERFAALVFSGITPDPGKIPSTVDGYDQVVKAIASIAKK